MPKRTHFLLLCFCWDLCLTFSHTLIHRHTHTHTRTHTHELFTSDTRTELKQTPRTENFNKAKTNRSKWTSHLVVLRQSRCTVHRLRWRRWYRQTHSCGPGKYTWFLKIRHMLGQTPRLLAPFLSGLKERCINWFIMHRAATRDSFIYWFFCWTYPRSINVH